MESLPLWASSLAFQNQLLICISAIYEGSGATHVHVARQLLYGCVYKSQL